MLSLILSACCLVASTVAVHAIGLTVMLKVLLRTRSLPPARFWPITWYLIQVAWWLILFHLVEIAIWGFYYHWQGCLPDLESAFYFAGVTYTTTGYGDLVLPQAWRLLGPVEALTGILMCGLSTGLFVRRRQQAVGLPGEGRKTTVFFRPAREG